MFFLPSTVAIEAITADVKRIEGWVQTEAEKFSDTIEKRRNLEIDAFVEQMRLKDEKLESFRWKMLSMEIESKRLMSHVENLDQDMSQLRHENMKLEKLLFERQEAFNTLKAQLRPQIDQTTTSNDVSIDKIVDTQNLEKDEAIKEEAVPGKENPEFEQQKNVKAEALMEETSVSPEKVETLDKSPSPSNIKTSNSPWRMDLQALGVSYKIKRLKQQLLMLERLTGKQENSEQKEVKGFDLLTSLLNKQISRYQSLQSKIDEICKRMVSFISIPIFSL